MAKKCILKNKVCEALQWTDNYHEMKVFCWDKCKITYETSYIDLFFMLTVDDFIYGGFRSVPINDWVVKIDDETFTVMNNETFREWFDLEENNTLSEENKEKYKELLNEGKISMG